MTVFLSDLTKVEFSSTLWKKVRTKEIIESQAKKAISSFEDDVNKFHFIPIDSSVIENAKKLLLKYGSKGLRTLDGIQLSTAVHLSGSVGLFATTDKLLNSFFLEEKLPTI